MNIIKKSGSWFSYGDIKLGQGRETVKQLLQDTPELALELENKIKAAITGADPAAKKAKVASNGAKDDDDDFEDIDE
jgi:recombination protein RecA